MVFCRRSTFEACVIKQQKDGEYHIPFKIKAPHPFFYTIRTNITHQPERGAGVASATTVNIPIWSDKKK
jgi:hypothetical protein